MTTMTLTIERTPRTLSIGGNAVDVEELDIRLPFTRKPACIDEVGGHGGHRIYITETRELTPAEFDTFARSLLMSRDWLAGKGGGTGDGHLCVEVTAPGRPYLYVNPEGSDYARYVARLGCTERSKNVRFPLGFQSKQRVHTDVATINSKEKTMTHTIPVTQNEDWGFFGTMNEDAQAAWPIAMTAISDATSQPLESARVFLDSRHGRHFADSVQNGLYYGQKLADAINAAIKQWMGWTIGRATSKEYGIPRGLPYLTGFVVHCEIVEMSSEDMAA